MRVVFDFDGTTVNTMPHIADAACGVVYRRLGMPYNQAMAWYWWTAGLPFTQQLETLRDEYCMSTKDIINAASELQDLVSAIYDVAEPFDDTIEAFEQLDYNMHLVSATSATLCSKFAYKWFPFALHAIESETKVTALHKIARAYQSKKVVFIGDTPNDAAIAQALDIRFIGVDRGIEIPWAPEIEVATGLIDALDRVFQDA